MRTLRVIAFLLLAVPAWAASNGFSRPAVVLDCPSPLGARTPAPDWRQDPMFRGIWDFEEANPNGSTPQFWRDSSANDNKLVGGGDFTTRRSLVKEQCRAYEISNTFGGTHCNTPACNASDFCPGGDFTAGCWVSPFDVIASNSYLTTFDAFATVGWRLGWTQPGSGAGNFYFDIKHNAAATLTHLVSAATYTAETYHHATGRFYAGAMEQVIDGVPDPNTDTDTAINEDCDFFSLGYGLFGSSTPGFYDECFFADGALDDFSICRIAVCGISGLGCSCDTVNPDDYDYRPLHASQGGPIDCDMPACDSDPQLLTTTTTSTSSTSSSSTTTTSTSSTTSTT